MEIARTVLCLVFLLTLVGCPQKKAQSPVQQPSPPKPISPTDFTANKDVESPIVPTKSRSVDELIVILRNQQEPKYQIIAAQMLGALKDPKAVGPLIEALTDKNYGVPIAALRALVEIGDRRAVEPLIAHIDIDLHETCEALVKFNDPRAVEPLIALLKKNTEPDEIIKALGELHDTRAVEPLIDAMNSYRGSYYQALAAEALCKLKDPRAVEPIIATLIPLCYSYSAHPDDHLGGWPEDPLTIIARVFEQLKDPRTVKALIFLLKIPAPGFQAEVAKALVKINDPIVITPLLNTLYKFYVSTETALALDHFGWQPHSTKEKVYYLLAKQDKDQLLQIWPDTKKVLLDAMDSGDAVYFEKALYVFLALGNEDAIPDLVKIIDAAKGNGYLFLATRYYMSGRQELMDAAQRWAKRNGVKQDAIITWYGDKWGEWK